MDKVTRDQQGHEHNQSSFHTERLLKLVCVSTWRRFLALRWPNHTLKSLLAYAADAMLNLNGSLAEGIVVKTADDEDDR